MCVSYMAACAGYLGNPHYKYTVNFKEWGNEQNWEFYYEVKIDSLENELRI